MTKQKKEETRPVRTSGLPAPRRASASRLPDLMAAAGVGVASLILYLATTARDIAWGDSAEFALVATDLGVPHTTGYPLYALLIRIAALVPLGSLPWRVNAMSGVFAAVAVVAAYALARRIGIGRLASATAALALMCARDVWTQSARAEVYTLHLAIVTLVMLAAWIWYQDRNTPMLVLALYLVGLGLAHHRTILLVVPALVVLVIAARRRPPLRLLAITLLPLTLYVLLPIRSAFDPVLDDGDPETLSALIFHLKGSLYRYRVFTAPAGHYLGDLREIGRLLADQWTPVALIAVALGLYRLYRRERLALVVLVTLAVPVSLFAAGYNIPDKQGYLLPVILVLALAIGSGAEAIAVRISGGPGRRLAAIILLVLPLAVLPHHRGNADRHDDHSLRDLTLGAYGRTPPGSLIITDDMNTYTAFVYLKEIENGMDDRDAVLSYLLPLPWYARSLAERGLRLFPEGFFEEVDRRFERSRRLTGKAHGRQRSADQAALVAVTARQAVASRPTFYVPYQFEQEQRTLDNLVLVDRGLSYRVLEQAPVEADSVALDFPGAARYSTGTCTLVNQRYVARRYATAANREGARRANRGDYWGAVRAFRQAVTYGPEYAIAWLNLGSMYADYLDLPGQAREAWRKYVEVEDNEAMTEIVRRRMATLPPGG